MGISFRSFHIIIKYYLGLFSRAIASSGSNIASWAQPQEKGMARKRTEQLAKRFDCFIIPRNWTHIIDCLRNVPAKNMSAVAYEFLVNITNILWWFEPKCLICSKIFHKEFDIDPKVPFLPVVEPDLPGAFISEHPRDTITESSVKRPFLTGITFDEGLAKSICKEPFSW